VRIGRGSRIEAESIELGDGVRIGDGVVITADRVMIAADSHIGDRCRVVAPEVRLDYNCVLFPDVSLRALTEATLGPHAKISRGAVLKAGRVGIGVEFWMNAGAEIGGGGWRAGAGAFVAGDRCHVGRNSHVNTADLVSLGDDTAIGMDCTIATHANWQPVIEGFPCSRGPVLLGSDVAIYTRSVLSPGVTVGSGGTIAAGSVVVRDVPERGLVAGVPARLLRVQRPPAEPWSLLREVVAQFCGPFDGERVRLPDRRGELLLTDDGVLEVRDAVGGGRVSRFDVAHRTATGDSGELSEAVRGHLFSHGLRFAYAGGYRRASLHPAALLAAGLED
jgi:acetyltransferase-like isoleucine patch superfamily enzyme